MVRSFAPTVITVLALALLGSLGCESTPDASAEAESTCAHMSERNGAQCPCEPAGSGGGCPHAQEGAQAASIEGEGCARAKHEALSSTRKGEESAQEGHEMRDASRGAAVCVGSDRICALAGTDECLKRRATAASGEASSVDPVCGATVAAASALTAEDDEVAYHFCSAACRDRFEDEPGKYTE